MTTCLILWGFPSCSPNSYDLSRHGLWGCPVVSGTRVWYSGSSGSCMLRGEASMDQTCSAYLKDAWSDWDLGNVEARPTPWALYCVPRAVPEQCLQCVRAHYPAGGASAMGGFVVMRGCTWSTTLVWMGGVCQVAFTWIPVPKVSKQNIILWLDGHKHITCQWF